MAVDMITPRLQIILDKAVAALSPKPGKAFIVPGLEAPWDNCCEDAGQVWVRVQDIQPVRSGTGAGSRTPTKANAEPCYTAWEVTLGVGVVRCVHSLDDYGNFPSGDEMSSDAAQMLEDEAAIRDMLVCQIKPKQMVRWTPLGALGGCAGGEWTAIILVPHCACD